MERCNELYRCIRRWLKGRVLMETVPALQRWRIGAYLRRYAWLVGLQEQNKAPRWGRRPVAQMEVRDKDVVREAHKQCSETLNKTMLTLLGVALFCVLTTMSSTDRLLLQTADSTIKVPLVDTPVSIFGFIVVGPCLLLVLATYLHIFYGYWLDCEGERKYLNQRLTPPIESIPTLFSFPDVIPSRLTAGIFYWLVPLVLGVMAWKAWALPEMGRALTFVTVAVTFGFLFVQNRRRSATQQSRGARQSAIMLLLMIGLIGFIVCKPHGLRRSLNLTRADLSHTWLAGIDMRHAHADLSNFQDASLQDASLKKASLKKASLQRANLQRVNLQKANLQQAKFQRADLQDATFEGANLKGASLRYACLRGARFQGADLQNVDLMQANLEGADFQNVKSLQGARVWGAKFKGAKLQGVDLRFLSKKDILTQEQLQVACVDGNTLLPLDLTPPTTPCPTDLSRPDPCVEPPPEGVGRVGSPPIRLGR